MIGTGDQRIVPYDEEWPTRAQELIALLGEVLGSNALLIEHIGSTAVPGLAARPIVDIQVSVPDVRDAGTFLPALEDHGYEHFAFPELLVDDYYVFVPKDGSNTEHIQVCERHSHQEHRHLAVREYLREHPTEQAAYADAKRGAAAHARGERSRYSAAKDSFVRQLEARALRWIETGPGAASRSW